MEPNKGAKKRKVRGFKYEWLDEENFKGWLAPAPLPTINKAFCTVCNKTIYCAKTDLNKHSQTVRHIENIMCQNKEKNINNDKVPVSEVHKNKVKNAEVKLAAFFAEHKIAFNTANHLIPLLKNLFDDSKVLQDISLAHDKCKNL